MLSLGVGIATGSKIAVVLALGMLGAVARLLAGHDRPLTRYHAPAVLLLVLAVTGAFGTAVAYEQAHRDVTSVDYTAEPCGQSVFGSTTAGDDNPSAETPVTTAPADRGESEFEDLPPKAQEIFLQALRTDGSYSTRERPDGIVYETDTPAVNYIEYESTCYEFVASAPFTLGLWVVFYMLLYVVVGVVLAAGWWSFRRARFRFPVAFAVGLTSGFVAVATLPGYSFLGGVALFFGSIGGAAAVTTGVLRRLERRRGERFRESMTSGENEREQPPQ